MPWIRKIYEVLSTVKTLRCLNDQNNEDLEKLINIVSETSNKARLAPGSNQLCSPVQTMFTLSIQI